MADTNSQTPSDSDSGKPPQEGINSRTTRKIAYILLTAYGVFISVVLVAAIYFYYRSLGAEKPDERWLGIFKDNLAFLSGLLATIIGYYFGNRNVSDALQKAREEEAKAGKAADRADLQEAKANEAIEVAKQQEAKAETLKSQIIESSAGDDPVAPEASPTTNETVLDNPKKDI